MFWLIYYAVCVLVTMLVIIFDEWGWVKPSVRFHGIVEWSVFLFMCVVIGMIMPFPVFFLLSLCCSTIRRVQ